MSLFAYFGTPESRSFQFLWTAGTQPLFSLAFRLFQRLSHLPRPALVGQEDESEKRHDAKEKEEGQPAATVAPVAAAAPAGAAVCPQGREGTGSKVRLPDRQPGESGVTPDAKVTRSAEPAGAAAASSEEEAGGLAPMRLNSNFSAAAGQAEMSDQNRC